MIPERIRHSINNVREKRKTHVAAERLHVEIMVNHPRFSIKDYLDNSNYVMSRGTWGTSLAATAFLTSATLINSAWESGNLLHGAVGLGAFYAGKKFLHQADHGLRAARDLEDAVFRPIERKGDSQLIIFLPGMYQEWILSQKK